MNRLKRLTLLTLVTFMVVGVVYGVSVYVKEVAHIAILMFTGEVQITDMEIVDVSQVNVTLYSDITGKNFTVSLYLDNAFTTSQTVSWSAAGTIEVAFTGLDLSAVTTIKVEVTG